jgi:hypothetical protein
MASTYSDLKIELIGTGEQTGTWGTTTNDNFSIAIGEAITGSADVAFSSADVTVTLTNTNASQAARNLRLNLTGTSGGARNLILGSGCQIEKLYLINNGLADAVTVKNTSGTGIAVPAGKTMFVYNNGTNVVDAVTHLTSLTTGTLSASGATTFTAGTASTSTTTGTAVITGGLGVSGRINAANFDGIVGANTAAAGNFTTLGATGVATFSAGTVSAPAITTTGDTNTGIFFPAADTIAFTEGGVESMRIDSSGNLGIGTTSPTYKLQIQSGASTILAGADSAATTLTDATQKVMRFGVPHYTNAEEPVGALFVSNESASNAVIIGGGTAQFNAATVLLFYTAANNTTVTGTERMRIDSSGNVGINTTTPLQRLDVAGSSAMSASGVTFYYNADNTNSYWVGGNTGATGAANAVLRFQQTGVGERMRLDASGNLGIGTSSPSSKLTVGGNPPTAGAIAGVGAAAGISLALSDNVNCSLYVRHPAAGPVIGTDGGNALRFATNGNAASDEKMRIDSSGNVGIGTSAPRAPLAFAATASTAGVPSKIRLFDDGASNLYGFGISSGLLDIVGGTGGGVAIYTNGANERMRIAADGNVGIGTSSPATKLSVVGQGQFNVDANGTGTQLTLINNSQTGTVVTKLAFQNGGSVKASINAAVYNNDFMTFNTGSDTERMRIDSSGNVLVSSGGTWSPEGNHVSLSYSSGTGYLTTYYDTYNLVLGAGVSSKNSVNIYGSSGTNAITANVGGSERMRINSSGNVGIGTTSPSALLTVNGAAWTAPGAPWQGTILAYNTNALGTDVGAGLLLGGVYQSGLTTEFAQIVGAKENATSGNYAGNMIFYTRPNGTTLTERMRIASDGAVLMGKTVVDDTTAGLAWRASGYLTIVRDNSCLNLNRITSDGEIVQFRRSATQVGNISVTTTATSYVTSSDYRLKENIAPMTGALDVVSALKPVTYNWKADGSNGQGFIAHELQAVVPECVTGEKDAVDEEGNPQYQGIDTSFLVATLTAAIQELKATVDAQAARIAALESK